MQISSSMNYSPYKIGNLSITSKNQTNSQFQVNENNQQPDGANAPEGGRPPKGAGPPPGGKGQGMGGQGMGRGQRMGKGGGRPAGPDLDLDNDGNWSKTEVEEYAAFSSETLGIELNVDELFETYDVDGDNQINPNEIRTLGENNGLSLPVPKEMIQQMMSGQLPRVTTEDSEASNEIDLNQMNLISKYMNAYNVSQNYDQQNLENLLEVAL